MRNLAGSRPEFRTDSLAALGGMPDESSMHWYLHVLRHYANFAGRARRSEYWYFVLVNIAFVLGLNLLDMLVRATLGKDE